MLDLILGILLVMVALIGLFYALCFILKLYKGCDTEEATEIIRSFFDGTLQKQFENDSGFRTDLCQTIKNIIGDKQYEVLDKLGYTPLSYPMISFNTNGRVPYIAISVIYTDINQQQAIENVVRNLVRDYLRQYRYPENIASNWSEREDIHIPLLIIRYARNKQEEHIGRIYSSYRRHGK